MASENEIKITVKAEVDKAKKDLKSVSDTGKNVGASFKEAGQKGAEGLSEMGGAGGKLGGIISKLPGPIKIAAIAIGAVVGAVVAFVAIGTKFADIASAQEQALNKLGAISKATGNNLDQVNEAARSLAEDGLMTFQESASALSNLLATGMSLPKAIELLKIAKDNAVTNRQANYDLGESVVVFTEGIKNENSMLTDSVGIQKNYSKILDEGAKALGKTAENLTAREKAQIVANGFIKEGSAFEGQAAKAADTYAGAKARASASIQNLSVTLGQAFMPAMKNVQGILESAAQKTTEWIRRLTGVKEVTSKLSEDNRVIAEKEKALAEARLALAKLEESEIRNTGDVVRSRGDDLRKATVVVQTEKEKAALAEIQRKKELAKSSVEEMELEIAKLKEQVLITGELDKQADIRAKLKQLSVTPEAPVRLPAIGGGTRAQTATERTEQLKKQLDKEVLAREEAAKFETESLQLVRDATKKNIEVNDDLIKKAAQYGFVTAANVVEVRKSIATDNEARAALDLKVSKREAELKAIQELNDLLAKAALLEKEMAAVGITVTEQDKKSAEAIKAKISEYEGYIQKRKTLIEQARDLEILTEEQITKMTNSQIEARIQTYKRFKEVFGQVMSGVKDIAMAAFELDKALRDQKLADDLHAVDVTHDARTKAIEDEFNLEAERLAKSNEFTAQVTAMEEQHSAAQQAERDASLADKKANIEKELAATTDKEEKERLQKELTAVNKEIAEEAYQKNLAALREKEKEKQIQIEKDLAAAKKAADDEKAKSDKAYNDEVKRLKRIAFYQDQDMKVAQAIMSGALAGIQAFATLGPILGTIAAIGIAVTTGLNIATIRAQKFPEYRIGSSYIPRDQAAILHEGERVLTREENRNYSTNMGGVTIVMNGVQDTERFASELDQYFKKYGGFPNGNN